MTVDRIDEYVSSRGLDAQLNKPTKIKAVLDMMERGERANKFNMIVDTSDGKHQNRRLTHLVQLGVLTLHNAPGLVPPPCPLPSGKDCQWEFVKPSEFNRGHGSAADAVRLT